MAYTADYSTRNVTDKTATCGVCGNVIDVNKTRVHDAWHVALDALLNP